MGAKSAKDVYVRYWGKRWAMRERKGSRLDQLLHRVDGLLGRLEGMLASAPNNSIDWSARAYRWHRRGDHGALEAIANAHRVTLDDLLGIDRQKQALDVNTRQFMRGLPCNNALLWGPRGTGKSTLIKALSNAYFERGLRVVEVEVHDLIDLPYIIESLAHRPEYFILFVDDLSFSAGDSSYRALKAALDGSLIVAPDNVLIYATSNRRHLVPEMKEENLDTVVVQGEIHHNEAVEEKISLSERFGIWLSFQPFSQAMYLRIVGHWMEQLGSSVTLRRRHPPTGTQVGTQARQSQRAGGGTICAGYCRATET